MASNYKAGGGGKPQKYNEQTGEYENESKVSTTAKSTEKLKNAFRTLKDRKIETQEKDAFKVTTPINFYNSLKKAKQNTVIADRWRVDLHNQEDYKKDKLFVTQGGSCIAIEPDGNIISVCYNENDNTRGYQLLEKAIKEGGDRLDAFGRKLFVFYTNNGFEPVSWTPFNEEYAPDEWKEAKKQGIDVGKEPVIFYKYTGRYNRNNNPFDYQYFINNTEPTEDYDLAKETRDKEI